MAKKYTFHKKRYQLDLLDEFTHPHSLNRTFPVPSLVIRYCCIVRRKTNYWSIKVGVLAELSICCRQMRKWTLFLWHRVCRFNALYAGLNFQQTTWWTIYLIAPLPPPPLPLPLPHTHTHTKKKENRFWQLIQTVSNGDIWHEISDPVFSERNKNKNINLSSETHF